MGQSTVCIPTQNPKHGRHTLRNEYVLEPYFYDPFKEVGVYTFANVGRSVGRPYLVRMITRDRIDLGLSRLAQTCISGCR